MIPVVFITDKNFIMQTHVAILSMIHNKNVDTEYDIFIVMAECSRDGVEAFECLRRTDVQINVIEVSLDEFRDIKQISHIPIACLLKFKICDLVSQYDKLIYLDGDIVVRGDLSELYGYDVGDNYAAAVPSLENIYNDEKRFNAGIMLFNAKKMRENGMSSILIGVRKSLGDRGSMDQQTFNLVMPDEIAEIPYVYNCIAEKLIGSQSACYELEALNELYHTRAGSKKELVQQAIIIHFATGDKPWKYSFVVCADEWYKFYKLSKYGNIQLHRDGRLVSRIKGVGRNLKKGGIKEVWKRLMDYTINRNKISDSEKNWG